MLPADGGPGASLIQLRAKQASTAERVELLRAVAPDCAAVGVPLVVNDDVEAALAGVPGVRGVHVGQGDAGFDDVDRLRARAREQGIPGFMVGVSTHDPVQLRAACHQGPDYVAYGPVLPTTSKERPDPVVGLAGLEDACRHAFRPVVAIGGLDLQSGAAAIMAGATAVACISAVDGPAVGVITDRTRALATALEQAARPLDLDAVCREIPVLDREQLQELARWSDDVGTHITLGLPARFRPTIEDGTVWFRASDVRDLLMVLDKRAGETWDQWRERSSGADPGPLVQLRGLDPTDR